MKKSVALRILINGNDDQTKVQMAKSTLSALAKGDTLDQTIRDAKDWNAAQTRIGAVKRLRPFRQKGKGVKS